MEAKSCRECGDELTVGKNWLPCMARKRNYLCQTCDKARHKAWYKAHREHAIAYAKTYYETYPDKVAARTRAYRETHRAEVAARRKTYRENNKACIAAREKAYRETRREQRAAQSREWYAAHKEQAAALARAWREANPDKIRANYMRYRARKAQAVSKDYDRAAVLADNNGTCVYCNRRPATAIDHIVPLSKGGSDTPDNVAGACKHCNSAKKDKPLIVWMLRGGWWTQPKLVLSAGLRPTSV